MAAYVYYSQGVILSSVLNCVYYYQVSTLHHRVYVYQHTTFAFTTELEKETDMSDGQRQGGQGVD